MIIELDTSLLQKVDNLSLNQLVLLSFVLDKNQKSNQGITPLIRLVSDSEVQDLIDRNLLIIKDKKYKASTELLELLTPKDLLFNHFNSIFPTMVVRPDGTRGFLKGNSKKCRDYYNKLVKGNSSLNERIVKALNFELSDKAITGKLGYMKTMWKWLTNSEWELAEEQMNMNQPEAQTYGTSIR